MDNLTALRARDDLLAVVAAWGALHARLTPSASSAEPVSGSTTPRLPIDIGVSDLMAEIEAEARFYGQVLLEEAGPEHGCDGACHGTAEHACAGHQCATEGEAVVLALDCPVRRDAVTTSLMPGLLEQVARRYGHFTAAEDRTAVDFCDTAHELRRKVSGLLGDPVRAEYLGPCPGSGAEGDGCSGELYLRPDRVDGACKECGERFDRTSHEAFLATQFEERLMTVSELRAALVRAGTPVPISTLYRWAAKERITTPDGELYRFSDAYALATQKRRPGAA